MGLILSIVSHGQAPLVGELLADIGRLRMTGCEIVFTLNVPETIAFDPAVAGVPVTLIRNATPRGFGANHNAAFKAHRSDYFCVLNPDIRLAGDPFPDLISVARNERTGVVAPVIRNVAGTVEDSARRFPTPGRILSKALLGTGRSDYSVGTRTLYPNWVAGMFMLFRSEVFSRLGGFDERYFLYYEDVDLCARLRLSGFEVALCPSVQATHSAQRASHRDARYMTRHLSSMLRFFLSAPFRQVRDLPP